MESSLKYAFLLGKNENLSIAELGSFFGEKMEAPAGKKVVFVENLPSNTTPQNFLNRLGGGVSVLEIFENDLPLSAVQTCIEKFLKNQCALRPGKCNFAVNILPEKKGSAAMKHLLINIKKNLRNEGLRPNFMNNNFQNVSDVFAVKQGLVERGTWIGIMEKGEGKVALGFYIAAQDFESYSKRDYGKPFRDPQAGMLPPKLAQIMINLALPHFENSSNRGENFINMEPGSELIFDPFCGTGTILTEALLMGYSVTGSDSSQKMIDGAGKNLQWLKNSFRLNPELQTKLFNKNASKITSEEISCEKNIKMAVVTEPFLGTPLSDFPSAAFLQNEIKKLSDLYLDFFSSLKKFIPPGSPVVFIFPYWINKKTGRREMLSAKIIDKILGLGYIKATFDLLKKDSLFYERPDQIVGREIIKLIPE